MSNNTVEKRIIELISEYDSDEEEIIEYIEENTEDYDGELSEFAFREAIRQGKLDYIDAHIGEFDLMDGGDCSTYLDETDDAEILERLFQNGASRSWGYYADFRFAVESGEYEVIAYSESLQHELFQKYLMKFNLSEDDVITLLSDEDEVETFDQENDRSFNEDMEAIGVALDDDDGLSLLYEGSYDGRVLRHLLEEFGWTIEFEGEEVRFETNGVYFIR